jgi:hypothetical protein
MLCSGRVGKVTEVSLICGLNTAFCVVVNWEERQSVVNFWIGYCWICSGSVEERQGFV